MNAEILCVGTELVLGNILNTNAQYLSRKLAGKGINVYYQSCVGDNPERIIKALSTAVTRSNLIIFTGGLGPTADDITIETVSKALDIPLEKNEEAYKNIVKYFEISGREMPANNEKQAFLPKGCVVLPNEVGTAPGCVIEKGNQCIVFMPGVPHELERMFEKHLSKYLDKYSDGIILSKFLHIYGIGESKIDEMAKDFINGENPTVAPYAKLGETELRVTAKAPNKADAEFLLNETTLTLSSMFGDCFYGYDDVTLESVVVNLLKSKGKTIATAESCTAGYISKRITDISGASKVFKMGVTTYSNESKTEELSVPADLIEIHGAVSREVAACMAKGIRLKSGADIGVSITGIAGPDSDGSKKPVGLSYIGISDEKGEYVIKSMKGPKPDREYIRYTSASEALNFVRLFILERLDTLEIKNFNAVLLNEQQEIIDVEEEPIKTETKPKINQMPSYLTGVSEELLKTEEEKKINLVAKEDEQSLANKPKYNDKSSIDVNIKFDENEYTPVEAKEFEAFDVALEQYEKDLVKQHNKGSWKNFFIRSTDEKEEKIRKIILYIAIIIFIISIGWSVYFFINPAIQQYKISVYSEEIKKADNSQEDYYSDKVNPKFLNLLEKNSDTIGWITINGTNIDYPVLKSKEPDFYMRRGFDKSFSREGSLFADKDTSIEYKNESKNIVIYGHHMVSTGTMFKELDNFTNVNFYKKHPNLTFDTLYRDGDYKIFAVFITNSLPEQDNGNFYNYMQSKFATEEEFLNWISEAKLRSLIKTNVDINATDEILTLQTCNDSFESNNSKARLIVMARRVRDGEEKSVDTSTAQKNPNPKLPQMWYDENSQVNPYYSIEENRTLSFEEANNITTTTTKKPSSTTTTTTTTTAPVTVAVNNNQSSTSKSSTTTKKTTTTKHTTTKKTTTTKHTTAQTITTHAPEESTTLKDVINENE